MSIKHGTAVSYRVFTRTWWRENPTWPNGLEPDATGRKTTLARGCTEEEARAIARQYNETHEPGPNMRRNNAP